MLIVDPTIMLKKRNVYYDKKMFSKRTIAIIILLLTICGVSYAKEKVGVCLEAPIAFCQQEKVHKMVDEKVTLIFNKEDFEVMPLSETTSAVQLYRAENDMTALSSSGWGKYAVALKKEDIYSIAKELECDYVFFVRLSNDMPRYSSGLFHSSAKTTISCDVRVLNVAGNKYTFSKQVYSDGKSTAIYMGAPSFGRAYFKAFSKALDKIKIDTSTI